MDDCRDSESEKESREGWVPLTLATRGETRLKVQRRQLSARAYFKENVQLYWRAREREPIMGDCQWDPGALKTFLFRTASKNYFFNLYFQLD